MKICSNTIFLFIITSRKKVEDRFLYDAEFCIKDILRSGVDAKDIIVATDSDFSVVLSKWPTLNGIGLITSQQIFDTINSLKCDNLIVIADCHGSIQGIDAQYPIMPHPLTEALKNNPSFKNVLVFFGQCYAGIYNWVDVRHEDKKIVYIGATQFNSSLSYYGLKDIPWYANISVVAFRNWIKNPVDIDGDGSITVMDLYKYIAWFTNYITNVIEKRQTSDLVDSKVRIMLAMKEQGSTSDKMLQLEKEAAEAFENYIVPHQEPWILNALSAQQMQFE